MILHAIAEIAFTIVRVIALLDVLSAVQKMISFISGTARSRNLVEVLNFQASLT